VLVWLSVDLTQSQTPGAGRDMPPMTAVWIIALPLMDMARVMFSRMRGGQSPFVADRTHLHHLLLERGMPAGKIVLVKSALTAAGGAIGVGGWRAGLPDWAMFYTFIVVLAVYCLALRQTATVKNS
jgi:UDP-GlcNAc:undecaprenyl-phosphate GlcNAc-1-phosphate transferase